MIKHQPEALYNLERWELVAVNIISDYYKEYVSKKEAMNMFKELISETKCDRLDNDLFDENK
jgi:hypothetical protein